MARDASDDESLAGSSIDTEVSRRLSAALRAHAAVPMRRSGHGDGDRLVPVWTVLIVALVIGLIAGAAAGIVSAV